VRRRSRRPVPPDAALIRPAFEAVLGRVEAAKAALVAAVPTARVEGRPLADAVLGFEEELRAALSGMDAWRRKEHEPLWRDCRDGIEDALRRAERARVVAPALDFEALVDLIGEMMAPLDPFADAERTLGRSTRR
jgi:hypothetical protein